MLIESLLRHDPDFRLFVLCFDKITEDYLNRYFKKNVTPVSLEDFERRNEDIAAVKSSRSEAEYFFTCTSAWIRDVFECNREIEVLTYLDADVCFYSSPDPIFDAFKDKHILITPHRFPQSMSDLEVWGRFNVGWLSFRRSSVGLACLDTWRAQCLDWCYDRLEGNRFADQKYLDNWPENYGDAVMIGDSTVNLGPWSLRKETISSVNGAIMADGKPLVSYHFQGVRLFSETWYYAGVSSAFFPAVLEILYEPYVRELVNVQRRYKVDSGRINRCTKFDSMLQRIKGFKVGWPRLSFLLWLVRRRISELKRFMFNNKSVKYQELSVSKNCEMYHTTQSTPKCEW